MPSTIICRVALLLVAMVCGAICNSGRPPSAQNVTIELGKVPQTLIEQRMNRLRSKDFEREAELKAIFREAGCSGEQLSEEVVRRKDPPNVICTLPGTAQSLIIVSAHFDHAEAGSGAVDDWSGASLLPSLYEALRSDPRKHTFQFIGFSDEEAGLVGSQYHVHHLNREQLNAIKAVVNLECLGLSSPEVWVHVADPVLLGYLGQLSRAAQTPVPGVDIQKVGDDDTQPFRDKKVPTITIHSLTQATLPILHSKKDQLAAVNLERLYESFHFVARYLAVIDQLLD